MEITIHQSLCGENTERAWGLLKTTMTDLPLAKRLAFNTSLHDETGGISWQPTVRGFFQDECFLFMKTYPDKSPNVRPARVFSHVLIIQNIDLPLIDNLSTLISYFPKEINKDILIEPIHIDTDQIDNGSSHANFEQRFNKVVHGLNRLADYNNTIVWVGEEDFDDAIDSFWKILPYNERHNLNFGIYFNVAAVPENKLNFITIPENIETKFINRNYCLVRRNETKVLTEFGDQYLAGYSGAITRINQFKTVVGARDLSRDDVRKIGIVINTFERLDDTADIKSINSLSHIISEYSPDEDAGVEFKNKLVSHVIDLIKTYQLSDFLLIRQINLKGFKDAEKQICQAINSWIDDNMFSDKITISVNFSSLFSLLNEAQVASWWKIIIDNKLNLYLGKLSDNSTKILFNWLHHDFSILKIISVKIDKSSGAERLLIKNLPERIEANNSAELKKVALVNNWYDLYATLLIRQLSFESALNEFLEFEKGLSTENSIKIITNTADDISVINYAIINGDDRLLNIAGKLCHERSSNLQKIDIGNVHAQQVWINAINNGNGVFDGFPNARYQCHEIFDLVVAGKPIKTQILFNIASTEFANILNYRQRQLLWELLPAEIQPKFLEKTAASLLESISQNTTFEIPSDAILGSYIAQNAIADFLYYNNENLKITLPIFTRFTQIPESSLRDYVNNFRTEPGSMEATQLGQLINSRNYESVARIIYAKASKHNNWRFALAGCYGLLNFFAKAALAFTGILNYMNIPTDEWWEGAEDIISDLFANHNSIVRIWKDAGGKESDILSNSTAGEIWHDLLMKIRRGDFKKNTMNLLLKEIKKRYYETNDKFKVIYDLRKEYINTDK